MPRAAAVLLEVREEGAAVPPLAGAVRARIEQALARRIPGALTPQPRMVRPVVGTGIAAVDEVVGGGVPVGALTEVVGAECSGRTSLALSVVAQVMREGKVCAWVDVSDALSPESAAASGVDLGRLLWVRCGVVREDRRSAWTGFQVPEKYFVAPPPKKGLHGGGFGMHPREEERGMGDAVGGLLEPRCAEAQRRVVTSAAKAVFRSGGVCGTAEAVPLSKTVERRGGAGADEAYNGDVKSTGRTGERHASGAKAPVDGAGRNAGTEVPAYRITAEEGPRLKLLSIDNADVRGLKPAATPFRPRKKHWDRMDQALRAMDLLLQAGGFGAVVLDLGSMAPEHVSRIPLATWFRYRAAAERTQACVILLTQYPCAKSAAELVVRMEKGVIRTQGGRVMTGFERRVEVVRRRFCSEGEEAVGGDQSNARTFFVDRRVTSAAKAAINVNGDYGTAEAVPLSTTVQEQCGFSERCGMSAESWAKAPRLKPHAVMDVDYRGLKPVATPDMAGKKKPVQRAGVWESRPTWAMQARAVRRG